MEHEIWQDGSKCCQERLTFASIVAEVVQSGPQTIGKPLERIIWSIHAVLVIQGNTGRVRQTGLQELIAGCRVRGHTYASSVYSRSRTPFSATVSSRGVKVRPCAGQCHKHELQDKAQSGPVSPVVAHGGFGHIPRGGVTQEHGSWTF